MTEFSKETLPSSDKSNPSDPATISFHPCDFSAEQLLRQCQMTQTRRGGPGGQHRNKVESAIVLVHQPTGVSGQAGERRSQHQNREVAIHRLRVHLALAIRSNRSAAQLPSAVWLQYLKGSQLKINCENFDFPRLLAEALDCIYQVQFDLEIASRQLRVSKSQLVKFLKQEPAALRLLNQRRSELGLSSLK
jgi:hypothetical protein